MEPSTQPAPAPTGAGRQYAEHATTVKGTSIAMLVILAVMVVGKVRGDVTGTWNAGAGIVFLIPFLAIFGAMAGGARPLGEFLAAAMGLGMAIVCSLIALLSIPVAEGGVGAMCILLAITGGMMYSAGQGCHRAAREGGRPPMTREERRRGLALWGALTAASVGALVLAGTGR